MSDFDFSVPQRQSKTGIILIFANALVQLLRNLWVVLIYFFVKDLDVTALISILVGLGIILFLTLGYSLLYFMKFRFHIDTNNREFVLHKGVVSSDIINIPFDKIQQVNFKRDLLQRVLNVYSVVIDTAGSQDKEVEIKALSRDKANALAERLMELSGMEDRQVGEEESEDISSSRTASTPEWQHKVSLLTLIKVGLTSNYLRGVAILVAFYFTLREQFMLEETLPGDITENPDLPMTGTLLFFIALLVIGMLVTVAKTVIEYYDLNLKKFRDTLQVEMGLKNNTRVSIKSRRIQLMQVLTNPIQQRLDLYKVKIALASSQDDLDKSQIKIPGLPPAVVEEIKNYFFKKEISEKNLILPHKIYLMRKISRGLIPLLIGVIIGYLYTQYISLAVWISIAGFYLVLMTLYNYFYYKNLRLYASEEFLVKQSGLWIRKTEYLEMFKLQSVSVSQPLWYKKRGLVNLIFHSAAGDISYPLVRENEVLPVLNYLLYRVESTSEHWM